jgi:hypothetical protein
MNKRIVFISLVVSALCLSFQQKMRDINVSIKPTFKNENLVLNNVKYVTGKSDTITISTFKFYISNVEVEFENGTSYKEPQSYHLIDLENEKSLQFQFKNAPDLKIKQLVFNVGIDSTTNVSGNLEGDLDPALGMYWAWNSGYINMKLEGKSSSCKSVKKDFQFHIGGYLPNQNALQSVVLNIANNSNEVRINVDVSQWLNAISLSETNSIMIPGEKAIMMANQYKKMFVIDEKK